jgi:hypothetical protein
LKSEPPSRLQVKVAAPQFEKTVGSVQVKSTQQSGSTEHREGVQGLLPDAVAHASSAMLQQRNGSPTAPVPQTPPAPHPQTTFVRIGVFSQMGTLTRVTFPFPPASPAAATTSRSISGPASRSSEGSKTSTLFEALGLMLMTPSRVPVLVSCWTRPSLRPM